MTETFDLQRFVDAQDPVYETVRQEMRDGRKRTHWMWFMFPQIAGLGFSAMSQRYALRSQDEARAFLEHPILGKRLLELTSLVMQVDGKSAHEIFGSPDDMKFHSCLTLFAEAVADNKLFEAALEKYFNGMPDVQTLHRLRA